MAKGRRTRICTCVLRPSSHKVEDESAHRLELKTYLRAQNANTVANTVETPVASRRVRPFRGSPHPSRPPPAHIILAEAEKSMRAVISEASNSDAKQPSRVAQNTRILDSLSHRIQAAITSLRSANRSSEDTNALWET
ncbi:hypothetical protein K438DRAFT_1964251 [Mycena galopus ATCC 62051]|nr:hypothetical protein K438DRAFT_1964251 [Mycena galopus ATCC 62051]